MNTRNRPAGNLALLSSQPPPAPCPSRIAQVRAWLVSKAIHHPDPVCAISIVVTDSTLASDSIGIEPEHVAMLTAELKRMLARLEAVARPEPALKRVTPIRS
jgi:hypothetical protein